MSDKFSDENLPGLFHDANQASLSGQSGTVTWSKVRLIGAVLAAVGGALSWKLSDQFDAFAFLALVGFAAALVAEVILLTSEPERDWYSGRAVAESAKTLGWRYAVGGSPFPTSMESREAKSLLHQRLKLVAEKGKDRIVLTHQNPEITPQMDALRRASFENRKNIYLDRRIRDQREWYGAKSKQNRKLARRWGIALVSGEVVAVLLAATRAFGVWEIDFSGILAAAVSSAAAWIGLKQHTNLAAAYSVAVTELGLTKAQLEQSDENTWADVVADAEEAISREHTMWLASRTSG